MADAAWLFMAAAWPSTWPMAGGSPATTPPPSPAIAWPMADRRLMADVDESYMSGKAAVENAVAGKTDYMPGFKCTRDENGYKCEIELLPLSEVANTEKKVPRDWINEEGNGVTQAFIDYALPLIEGENVGPKQSGLPRFAKLKKIKAEA